MNFFRNKPDVSDNLRPAIVLLDGSEEPRDSQSRNSMAPLVMDMRPIVLILLKSSADSAGPDLNGIRKIVIPAICSDAGVLTVVGKQGELHYGGCETGFIQAVQVAADMGLTFSITYTLNPNKLAESDRREEILAALFTALESIPTSD